MRIAIPDDYQNCINSLDAFNLLAGHEINIISEYISDPVKLAQAMNHPEAIILTRTRTPITKPLLNLLPDLKIISQTGKNAGHIDVDACRERSITIIEGKGNPISTAELTWSLIMNGLRLVPQAIEGMKNGLWQTNIGRAVNGKTIGIWGYGKIGKRVARYARAFDAEVLIWGSQSSMNTAYADGFLVAESREAFFSNCDVVSLNLRLNETTNNIVKQSDLANMKSDALFVNTSRAGLIESNALLEALKKGRPGFAALDVFDEEPIFNTSHPLLNMPNVICTPHLGYVEKDNYENYFGQAFQNLLDHLSKS